VSESADSGRGLLILKWYTVWASREVLCFARFIAVRSRISLLLLTRRTSLKESLSHLSVDLPGHLSSRRSHCATDRNEGPLHGTRPLFATTRSNGQSPSRSTSMNATSFSFGLLIVLFTILLLHRMHKLKPHIPGYGSQRMCPSCGLITSRLKACCLECGKSLTDVRVTSVLEK
jgi:hypothetical protein